jgi:hypothetical protein
MATAIILSPSIAAVTVALRLYTRRFLVKVRFFEDYCILCAMACSITMSIFMGISVVNGFGRHIEFVSAQELVEQGKVAIGGIIFYILTHMALKLSILLQYVRISVMPFEKIFCYTIIAILVAQSLAMAATHLALCRPFHALWTPNVPGTVCLDRTMVYFAQLGLTIGMDFAVLVAPLFILRHLTLPWIQKIMILVVLSFGGMACIISVLRLLTVVQSTQSKDSTYEKVGSALYGVIEPNLGIFCASIVTLKPLFNRCAPQMSSRVGLTDNDNHTRRAWPKFHRPAMFATSRLSRADKDFIMLSSDLTSSGTSRNNSARGDEKGVLVDAITPAESATRRLEEESATKSSNTDKG